MKTQNKNNSQLNGHLQKTPYTALYWGGSCWRGRRPPFETPAFPCMTSVKTGAKRGWNEKAVRPR